MSNIGKKHIALDQGVQVAIENGIVTVSGTKGTLTQQIPAGISVIVEGENGNSHVKVTKDKEIDELDKYFGLTRSLIANMIQGVSKGFEKKLELSGVGFRARVEGDTVVLNVGFAVPVRIQAPNGVFLKVDDNTLITVSGIDKQSVGNTASIIRGVKPPDPYKGKGIKYLGEKIRRKVGKAAKAVGGK